MSGANGELPAVPALVDDVVHVWWAAPSAAGPHHLGLLDDAERRRYAALRRPQDQARFLTACALLRTCAAGYLGCGPAEVRVHRHCPSCDQPHGKPTLPDSRVEVSLSHSGDRVVLAAARDTPLGVDVEQVARTLKVDDLAGSTLTPAEAALLGAVPVVERTAAFLTLWTCKEAVLKATGDGLRVPLRDLEIGGPLERPRLSRWMGRPAAAREFTIFRLDPGGGHVAHLAAVDRHSTTSVVERDGSAVLTR